MKRDQRSYLTAADSAWLRMEEPTNLMTITGVLTLKERLPIDTFRRLVADKLAVHDRFRLCVSAPRAGMGRPHWEDRGFSLDDHFVAAQLPAGNATKGALQSFVSEQMSTPLDHAKPLWKFFYFEEYEEGSALVARLHHCIGDGMSLMQVLLGMTDAPPEDPGIVRVGTRARESRGKRGQAGDEQVAPPSLVLEALKASGAATKALGRLLAMRADPLTVFKGPLSKQKLAVWSDPIPLDGIKQTGKALGGTINDVLLTAVTGALREYMQRREQQADGLDLRAVVPVNLRQPGDDELCNKFGLVYLSLPVGVRGRLERLRELRRRMNALKRSPEPYVVYGMLKAFGMTNAAIQSKIVNLLSKNATAVMTNVPGPRSALSFSGVDVDSLMFWVPQSGRLGLGASILSYNNEVRVGITTDRNLVPDPEALVAGFHSALGELFAEGGSA